MRESHGGRDLVADRANAAGDGVAALRIDGHIDRRLLSAPGGECTRQRHFEERKLQGQAGCLTYTGFARCAR